MLAAEFFWKLFEITGSIKAYLIYKELALGQYGKLK
ncbi:YqzL family protein [Thermovenabulum sp.]